MELLNSESFMLFVFLSELSVKYYGIKIPYLDPILTVSGLRPVSQTYRLFLLFFFPHFYFICVIVLLACM